MSDLAGATVRQPICVRQYQAVTPFRATVQNWTVSGQGIAFQCVTRECQRKSKKKGETSEGSFLRVKYGFSIS